MTDHDAPPSQEALAPIVKTLVLRCRRELAFSLFTTSMADWWPLASHSVSGSSAATIRFAGRVDGNITEVAPDGTESVWGTVTHWDPPAAFATTWHPGTDPATATHLRVEFTAVDETTTELVLTHSGWETRGDAMRAGYHVGWDAVLAGMPHQLGATRPPIS